MSNIIFRAIRKAFRWLNADEPKQEQPQAEQPMQSAQPEKIRLKAPPKGAKKIISYPIYLLLTNDLAFHTFAEKYVIDNEEYFYILYNKKFLHSSEFIKNEELLPTEKTLVLELPQGGYAVGKFVFTEKAKNYVGRREESIRRDRASENATRTQDKKFAVVDGVNIIIAIILISIGVFLVMWVWFGGMPGIIGAINQAPATVKAAMQPASAVVNQTFTVGG